MERFLLWFIFVLSTILAIAFLYNAQEMNVAVAEKFCRLAVFGYLMALMSLTSGVGLAVTTR